MADDYREIREAFQTIRQHLLDAAEGRNPELLRALEADPAQLQAIARQLHLNIKDSPYLTASMQSADMEHGEYLHVTISSAWVKVDRRYIEKCIAHEVGHHIAEHTGHTASHFAHYGTMGAAVAMIGICTAQAELITGHLLLTGAASILAALNAGHIFTSSRKAQRDEEPYPDLVSDLLVPEISVGDLIYLGRYGRIPGEENTRHFAKPTFLTQLAECFSPHPSDGRREDASLGRASVRESLRACFDRPR